MKEFRGKTAFVTGGASGMGFAMAEAFGREGMNVMLADIEEGALQRAVEALRDKQVRCEGVVADVSSRDSMRNAALETLAKFGKVHVVVNNAGVAVSAPMERLTEEEWRWVLDVNLKGVANGVEIFVPLIDAHGEGGHIVSTASLAGLFTGPGVEPYSATKYAVVGMSEGWRAELKAKNIGVSVLCPALVNTNILDSYRNRPDALGGARPLGDEQRAQIKQMMEQGGMPADVVAMAVLEAVKDDTLYIIPHPEYRAVVEPRLEAIERGFDRAEKSPALNGAPAAPSGSMRGKTVFITGGASGIGLGMAQAFGAEGANVMIADVQADAIPKALELLRAKQIRAEGVQCDVTSRASVRAAALETIAKFGKVHYLCNNAGVAITAPIAEMSEAEWDWQNAVNILGVVHGVETFAPLIAAHGEGGHIVNTASGAGLVSGPQVQYSATKYAVVAMSEGWREQLKDRKIGVSVLCPGYVNTNILASRRNRLADFGGPGQDPAGAGKILAERGIDPLTVGQRVLEGVMADEDYVLTHWEWRENVEKRHRRIRAAFDYWEKSPAINTLPKREPPPIGVLRATQ
ncbi:SDR family NAD(P)-dependent oxidoreductase [uncultured Phenylobacterium sp.]|uniref:SDR family NAD(P)-dependent oxidoreductase n=1 Tax=uncultured Phenylobacterium sp. TaxID=349273 RepID=UPI0025FB7FC1|nr:SDR family NAD(P)-dependent oxidoreductase [uncultured Phenylobacterium sp.]